ncbi:hypothetical protein [Desulfopila inferna]|uniref:hypothetical protein n=1 Tax=Desulfopila inferna TaxID=468528 RepID=UPI001965F9CF|nr:hypothetical protein [Desulfopila inferna]MBM9605937.1 hypothetical protein [Desulfopila inferna]
MSAAELVKLVEVLIWPLVILVLFFSARKQLFEFIFQCSEVEVNSNFAKVIIKNLKEEHKVSSTQIKNLRGLTGHDLWALQAFMEQSNDQYKYVKQFNPQKKAMVFSFVEMGLLEIVGTGENRSVQPTELASEVIEAASDLL